MALVFTFRNDLFFDYSWYLLLWNINDLILGGHQLFRLLHCAFFFTNVSIMAAIVFISQTNLLEKKCFLAVIAETKTNKRTLCSGKVMKVIFDGITEHNQICTYVMTGNRALWGPVMGAFVISNLPISCYVLSQIILPTGDNSTVEVIVLNMVLVIQLLAFYVIMRPMSKMCKRLHSIQNTIVSLQQHLMSEKFILLKCKLDDLKVRLRCGPKVAITIGVAREVTEETLVEVFVNTFSNLNFKNVDFSYLVSTLLIC